MNPVLSIALSGLQSATKRLGVSANNVANALTSRPTTAGAPTPQGVFAAQEATDRALAGGGVATDVRDREPATVTGPDPASPTGLSAFPNVDLAEEAVNQKVALASYRANAAVIRVQQDIDDALLDIET
jgi:flagellar basal body rod protein FlgC